MKTLPSKIDVFISYAREDEESIARPLARVLRAKGLKVWYDRFELKLGENLRQVIDRGLGNARFGVVILSPSFFAKRFPQLELDALLARESKDGTKVLLPVYWFTVNRTAGFGASRNMAVLI